MSEMFDPDTSQLDEEVPDLSDEPDNEPVDGVELPDVEAQDREGTERPAVDKHPED
jgi:hypothetical protein